MASAAVRSKSQSSTRGADHEIGRLLGSEVVQVGSTSYSLTNGYNANGQISSLTYPDNTSVSFSPDAFGRPTNVGSYATNFTYWPSGLLHQFEYGDSIYHTTNYDNRQLPSESIDGSILDWAYTYDGNANPLTITDEIGVGTNSKVLGYDTENRLHTANASRLWGNATYTYDNTDNLTVDVTGTQTTTFSIDGSNRVSSFAGNALSYNGYGNLTQKGTGTTATTFTYGGNLLTKVVQGDQQTDYSYGGDDLRATTIFTSDTEAGSMVTSIYDHGGRLMYETTTASANPDQIFADGFEIAPSPTSSTKYYYAGNHVLAKDVKNGTTDTVTYVHTDALGSPVATTNSSGTVTGTTTRLPYGSLYASTGAGNLDGIGFAGQYADANGLVYMHERYYDPQLHRFITPDSRDIDPSTALNFNRFNYADNVPYTKYDPDGRDPIATYQDQPGGPLLQVYNFLHGTGTATISSINRIEQAFENGQQPPPAATIQLASLALGATGVGSLASEAAFAADEAAVAAELGGQNSGGAPSLYNLGLQLSAEEAASSFTASGELTQSAIQGSTEIIPSEALGNPQIPSGYSKYATDVFQSPSGDFQTHFYMNSDSGDVFYGLDYKSEFTNGISPYTTDSDD